MAIDGPGADSGGAYNLSVTEVRIADDVVLGRHELVLIAGPCVIESGDHALRLGQSIAEIARRAGVPYVFKASFDKANRTSGSSFRGPGLEEGLRVLARVRRPFPVEPVRTLDGVHLATAESLGEPPQLVTVVTRDARVRDNARALGYAVE